MARIFNIDSDDIGKALNINNQKNIETNINNNNNINDLQYLKEYINYSKDIIKCRKRRNNEKNKKIR